MQIKKITLNTTFKTKSDCEVYLLGEKKKVDALYPNLQKAKQQSLIHALNQEAFKGKKDKYLNFGDINNQTVLIGTGSSKEKNSHQLKKIGAKVLSSLPKTVKTVRVFIPETLSDAKKIYDLVMGMFLYTYEFDKYLSKKKTDPVIYVELCVYKATAALKNAVTRAKDSSDAVSFARDLVNEPASVATPAELVTRAKKIATQGKLTLKVLQGQQLVKENMHLYLAVGAGSTKNPPKFIHLSYKPKGAKASKRKVYLIGKGVTFDSGGLSMKSPTSMMEMKIDMAGAAAVLGAMQMIAKCKPNFEVHTLVAATENMVDGHSYRPGDIITGRAGKSVEVLNTDAEGRLTLADAITYAVDNGATEIIDLATLTGACMVALGPVTAGLYSNNDALAESLLQASHNEGEHLWRLPLTKSLKKMLKSPIADLKNIGGSYGGSITAALFLEEFVEKTTWAHLDIAGPASCDSENAYIKKGGRGFGVTTLVEYLCPFEGK